MTRRRWWLLAGAVVGIWVVVAGVLLLRAADDLRAGRDAAERARDVLDPGTIAEGQALPDLREARERFRSADAAAGSVLLAPVKLLPVVGRQLRSVDAMAGTAAEVTDAATEALARTAEVLDDPEGGGPARLRQIESLEAVIGTAHRRVSSLTDLGPRVGLLGPLAKARNELSEELLEAQETLRDASAGAAAATQLLAGPRRYLLVAANNAEMRAGSGMWLSGGVLATAGGRLDLGEVSPLHEVADTDVGEVPIADRDLRERWGDRHPEADWRTLMFSPRLPASAALGVEMWRASGQDPVDGILVLDPVALAGIVRATGPVEVEGRRIAGDQVVDELLKRQYERGEDNDDRRRDLSLVAEAAFEALDSGDWSPATLASELSRAIAGRHVLAWSSDPVEQRGWEAAGMAGDLRPDSLLLSVINRGTNKLDPYLDIAAELRTERSGGDTLVTVRLTFRNLAPDGLPRYVSGPGPGFRTKPGEYIGLVTVNVPGAASDVRFLEGGFEAVRGPDGATSVVAAELRLVRGMSRELQLTFRLPGRHGSMVVEPSARVPAVAWRGSSSTWQDLRPHVAKW